MPLFLTFFGIRHIRKKKGNLTERLPIIPPVNLEYYPLDLARISQTLIKQIIISLRFALYEKLLWLKKQAEQMRNMAEVMNRMEAMMVKLMPTDPKAGKAQKIDEFTRKERDDKDL